MIGFGRRVILETLQSRQRQFVDPLITLFQLLHEFFAHAARPKAIDVIGDARDGIFAAGLPPKEITDVIRHLGEMGWGAHGFLLTRSVPNIPMTQHRIHRHGFALLVVFLGNRCRNRAGRSIVTFRGSNYGPID